MAAFNIVIVRPSANHFISAAFLDIAVLLQLSLKSLGHACDIQNNNFDAAALNIVLGYHLLPDAEAVGRHPCVVYQLEQLPAQYQGWLQLDQRKIDIMRAARAVWDFSPENIAFLTRSSIDGVRHVPFGFHEGMETVIPAKAEMDIFFYGTISVRRKTILEELAKQARVKTSFGVYGARRDERIARSKIVLNLRSIEGPSIMEQPRISHLLNNRRFVVSEDAADNPYGDALTAVAYDRLVDTCRVYLAQDAKRQDMAERGYEFLKARPMTAYLEAVL